MEFIVVVLMGLLCIFAMILKIYGVLLSFKTRWYLGVLSLLIPGMAIMVGAFKLFANKDILEV